MRKSRQNPSGRFRSVYNIVVIIMFLGTGIAILLSPYLTENLTERQRFAFGIVLVLYSLYRSWKVLKQYRIEKQNPYDEDED